MSRRLPTALLNHFACSGENPDHSLVVEISKIHSRETLRCYLERHGRALEDRSKGLVDFLRDSIGEIDSMERSWDLSFGTLYRQLTEASLDPLWPAVCAALHLASRGIRGDWSAGLPDPYRFRWHHYLLPPGRQIACTSLQGSAKLELDDGDGEKQKIVYSRRGKKWKPPARVESFPVINAVAGTPSAVVICPQLGAMPEMDFVEGTVLDEAEFNDFVQQCAAGFDLIAQGAPEYLPWILHVITHVVPCHAEKDILSSGSSSLLPGWLRIGIGKSPGATAEMLIHEASHQYYYLACKMGYTVDGSDTDLYYSPAKGTPRPIEKIVVAYHAFANVDLFYRSCLKNGFSDEGYISTNEERLQPQLQIMREHLHKTASLTPIGNALIEPLLARARDAHARAY